MVPTLLYRLKRRWCNLFNSIRIKFNAI